LQKLRNCFIPIIYTTDLQQLSLHPVLTIVYLPIIIITIMFPTGKV